MAHYSETATGFVVYHDATIRQKDGTRRKFRAWWFGGDHGFGTTFGTLDYSVAVFPSRKTARAAITTGYRGAAELSVQSVSEARRYRDKQRSAFPITAGPGRDQ